MFQVIEEGKEASVKFYNDWVEDVKKTVPKERLLIFSVKEGWEPLCKFLDVPVPEEPFPRTNDSKAMSNMIRKGMFHAYLVFLGVPAILALLAYIFREPLGQLYHSLMGPK